MKKQLLNTLLFILITGLSFGQENGEIVKRLPNTGYDNLGGMQFLSQRTNSISTIKGGFSFFTQQILPLETPIMRMLIADNGDVTIGKIDAIAKTFSGNLTVADKIGIGTIPATDKRSLKLHLKNFTDGGASGGGGGNGDDGDQSVTMRMEDLVYHSDGGPSRNVIWDITASGVTRKLSFSAFTSDGIDNTVLVMKENGNFGIGIDPVSMLDIKTLGSTFATSALIIRNSINDPLFLISDNGNVGIGTPSTPQSKLDIKTLGSTSATSALSIKNSNDTPLFFISDGGNVGIGTTTPQSKLDINGKLNINSSGLISWAAGWKPAITSEQGTAWVISDAGNDGLYKGIGMTNTGWYFINSATSPTVEGYSSGKYPFQCDLNGNVTCGTLTVVNTLQSWSDYVFNKDYKLLNLKEVEEFIDSNKHLPGVPSAAEVEKNGISLGDMDATLLKKIEELTLYVIEQNKQIEQLKKQIKK